MVAGGFLSPDAGRVTLGQLFDACRARMMVVALDAVSQRARAISEVPSGYGCNCVCPECFKPMVARKGVRNAHSFAHRWDADQANCTHGPESVLHRIAKQIMEHRRSILFPDVVVEDELGPLVVAGARKVEFDTVLLEQRDGEVIPDVIGLRGDRRLHIEFRVTHGVTGAKLDKLRRLDVSVLEVDLSCYRHVLLADLDRVVTEEAPRLALQSPYFLRGPAMLADRIERTADEFLDRVAKFAPVRLRDNRFEPKLYRPLISPFVIETLSGQGIFEVADTEWQSWIAVTLLGRHDSPYSVEWLCGTMRRSGWCGAHEGLLKAPVAASLRRRGLATLTLEETVLSFLRHLEDLGLARRDTRGRWSATVFLSDYQKNSKIKRVPKTKEFLRISETGRFEHGKARLKALAAESIEALAAPEARYFQFEAWLLELGRRYGLSPFALVTQTTLIEEMAMLVSRIRADGNASGFPVFLLPLPSARRAGGVGTA